MVGALPLGGVIISATLQQAFETYCNVLPENVFYGRGERPQVAMMGNCSELQLRFPYIAAGLALDRRKESWYSCQPSCADYEAVQAGSVFNH